MGGSDKIAYLFGKPIEECTREELIRFIQWCGPIVKEHFSPDAIHFRAVERVEAIKHGHA